MPWPKIEARFAELAEGQEQFAPLADLAAYLANSAFVRAGLCGATSMYDIILGPSTYVFQNPHLRIEYDSQAKSFQMVFVDGSAVPWERTVAREDVKGAVERFLTKRARWYSLSLRGQDRQP